MATFWVGTSGYSYKEWLGPFYPAGLSEQQMLRYYAERFTSVEINYTFYRMPTVRVLQAWGKEVPEHFAFTLKAPRRITHDLRLRDAADAVSDFCDVAQALKHRLGAMLFQLPPFLKKDTSRLEDFLHQLPPGCRAAFEFRNQSWFADDVYECLRRFGVAICVAETEDRNTPLEVTADFGYFRLRKPEYSDDELAEWTRRMQAVEGQWKDAYVYFKHESAGKGPQLAARMRTLLDGAAEPLVSAKGG
ncbi:MAG: DUF72 domain-containing protein [Deltaproteobacteria bacterium]|nr:DUF72 domain-containing protein [Deltaproteobacteria bacterium]MBI3387514.1 DUF72 domain-containing protein [Deltaproteobacteria bacterium]